MLHVAARNGSYFMAYLEADGQITGDFSKVPVGPFSSNLNSCGRSMVSYA